MESVAIRIENLSKKFKLQSDKPQTLKERLVFWNKNEVSYKEVLKDITLDIRKGETVCLIGTNGCGKSTLLKLMTKILYPTDGTIETNGKLTSLLELGAGFHPDFTGRENIYFNAAVFGLTKQEIEKRIDTIIEFSELGTMIDTPVRTYSSGMYMRLAFSIAINVDAEILLIDEILAVGDQHFQEKCFSKLEELRDSDKTIVIVSHSLDSMRKLCDRAVWIKEGLVQDDGKTNEVIDKYLNYIALEFDDDIEYEIKDTYEGVLMIDNPSDSFVWDKESKTVLVSGWEINDDLYSVLKIYLNNEEVDDISRSARGDVIIAYDGRYGGGTLNRNAGWMTRIDVDKFVDGDNSIRVDVLDFRGNLITSEERTIRK